MHFRENGRVVDAGVLVSILSARSADYSWSKGRTYNFCRFLFTNCVFSIAVHPLSHRFTKLINWLCRLREPVWAGITYATFGLRIDPKSRLGEADYQEGGCI